MRPELCGELTSDDVIDEAWKRVRSGGGSPGLDGIDIDAFEGDFSAQVDALRSDLLTSAYRPEAYRAIDIVKPEGGYRRLVIACLRDRLLQTAATLLLQPQLEPLLHAASFAYRRGKGVQDALAQVCAYRDRGLTSVVCADIERFFDTVPHDGLLAMLRAAHVDEELQSLILLWLTATVVSAHETSQLAAGLPQGLPISPLLANLYLTPFDREMDDRGWSLVRYADDFIVCCEDNADTARAAADADHALAKLRLRLNRDKTQFASFEEGFAFLGARFKGNDLIPAMPHPYEAAFTPPSHLPHKPPPQGVPHMMLRTLYLQEQGSLLSCHNRRFVVTRRGSTLLDITGHQVDQLFVFGRVNLSSGAIAFCLDNDTPVYFFSNHGHYYGALRSPGSLSYNLRRAQFLYAEDAARSAALARTIVAGKIQNSIVLLAQHGRNHPETDLRDTLESLKSALARLPAADQLDQIRGIEGSAAAAYFSGFAVCLRGALSFSHRNRHPPCDPVNSLLSFGYSLVFYNLYSYVCARGLDPAIGLFHEPGHNHPALVSDLLEEFRAPIVDSLVLAVVNRGQLCQDDFYFGDGSPQPCLMKDAARVRYIEAFEEKMATLMHHPDISFPVDWRRILDLQVCRMARHIQGQTGYYAPYVKE